MRATGENLPFHTNNTPDAVCIVLLHCHIVEGSVICTYSAASVLPVLGCSAVCSVHCESRSGVGGCRRRKLTEKNWLEGKMRIGGRTHLELLVLQLLLLREMP